MIRTGIYSLLLCGLLGLPMSATAAPEISSVELHDPGVYPVFRRAPISPAFAIKLLCDGTGKLPVPEKIAIKISDPKAVEVVRLRLGDKAGIKFADDVVLAEGKPSGEGVVLKRMPGVLPDAAAENWLWVDVQLSKKATIGGLLTFSDVVVAAKGKKTKLEGEVTQRMGYMVAVPGEEVGNQTEGADRACKAFRIPGLIRSKKGTLIGCFDARYDHERDLCADIDVAVVRSEDGGQTWTAPAVGMDAGPGGNNGCGDPCILEDKKGRIWMQALACHFGGGASLNVSKTGLDPATTGQWEMVYSDNDGKTWSREHVNPTKEIKKPEWTTILAGPGNGITLKDGTIVFPAQIWQNGAKPRCMSTICYSADGGKSWKYGTGVPHATSECQVVELNDGSIMINCRNEARQGNRIVYVTKDLGETWEPHATNNNTLREPTCQGSIIRFKTKKHDLLLFSNPKSGGRNNMTIRYSEDDGNTWSEGYLYDNRQSMGYSSLAMINPTTVGLFYETSHSLPGRGERGIGFLSFPLESILTGETLPVKPGKGKKASKADSSADDSEADAPAKKKGKKKKGKKKSKKAAAEA